MELKCRSSVRAMCLLSPTGQGCQRLRKLRASTRHLRTEATSLPHALDSLKLELEQNRGRLTEEAQKYVYDIEAIAAETGLNNPASSNFTGKWTNLVQMDNMSDVKDGTAVLARICWGLFEPADLPIKLGEATLVYGSNAEFTIELPFEVQPVNGESGVLKGRWQALGKASLDSASPNQEVVAMFGGRISYTGPADQLDAWLKLFKPVNPTMDDKGFAERLLPHPMKASREFLYCSDHLIIQKGHGSHGTVLTVLEKFGTVD